MLMNTYVWLQVLMQTSNSLPESKLCLRRKTRNPRKALVTYRKSWRVTPKELKRSRLLGSQVTRKPRKCLVTWVMDSSKLKEGRTCRHLSLNREGRVYLRVTFKKLEVVQDLLQRRALNFLFDKLSPKKYYIKNVQLINMWLDILIRKFLCWMQDIMAEKIFSSCHLACQNF